MDKNEYERTLTLLELRKLKNLSQEFIAKKMGISTTGYRNREKKEYEFTIRELEILCELFKKSYADMIIIIRN